MLIKEKLLNKILSFLVALSAGGLMGAAFFDLIPETLEKFESRNVFVFVIAGIVLFLLIEKLLFWRHCHEGKCPVHTFAYLNLLGDGIHNFIDGLIIASSFVVSFPLGVASTFAIIIHEIPQELGDFGVFVYAGFNKYKALLMNFATALAAVAGGLIGYYFLVNVEGLTKFLLPFAAGGFIYISASDLLPEIRKETNFKKFLLNLIVFLGGIALLYLMRFIVPE